MLLYRTEGIVLHTIPFKDHHQIVTFFTPDKGIQKGVAHYALSKKSALKACFEPLNVIEIEYTSQNRDLEVIKNAHVLQANLRLRESLEILQAACELLRAIHQSQVQGKEAPLLYRLLKFYLELLPNCLDPYSFIASFKLKLLLHDGYFVLRDLCHQCQNKITSLVICQGESYCENHIFSAAIHFVEEEANLVYALALNTSKELLKAFSISKTLKEKVDAIFVERLAI